MESKTLKEKIINGYIDFLVEKESRPDSIYDFIKEIGIEEKPFTEEFGALEEVEQEIWKSAIEKAIEGSNNEPEYSDYCIQEKILSFYFTLFEVLKKNRSFYQLCYKLSHNHFLPSFLKKAKIAFRSYLNTLLKEGLNTGEIAERKLVSDKYYKIFEWQMLLIVRHWIYDTSSSFEKSDEFVEKSVNLSFDVVGRNFLDSSFEFVKFLLEGKGFGCKS